MELECTYWPFHFPVHNVTIARGVLVHHLEIDGSVVPDHPELRVYLHLHEVFCCYLVVLSIH
jgi:hypothetical protein